MNKKIKWWMFIFPIVFFLLSTVIIVEGAMSGNKSSAQSKHLAVIFDNGPKNASIIDPVSITLDNSQYTLNVNDTIDLNPVFTPSDTTDKRVKYNVLSGSECISITGNKLKGLKEGNSKVEVISEANSNVKYEFNVTVEKEKITNLKGALKKDEVIKGATTKFEVTSNKEDMSLNEITFVSSNSEVASISNDGIIRTNSIGNTEIYAYSNDNNSIKTETYILNVIDGEFIAPTSISFDQEISTYVGKKLNIKPFLNDNCSDVSFSFKCDSEYLTFGDDYVISKKEGTYTIELISINDPSVKTSFHLNVLEVRPSSISVSYSSIQYGKTEKLNYSLVSEYEGLDITYPEVEFESSDTSIASIDSNGYLVGLKKGSVNITVYWKKDRSINGSATITFTAMDATKFDNINYIVRKLIGHFGSFLVTGVFGILSIYFFFIKDKYIYIAITCTLVYGLILAMLSEFLQIFAGNRGPSWNDVGIDFAGYFIGALITFGIFFIVKKVKKNKMKMSN